MVGTLWLIDIASAVVSALLLFGILAIHVRSWKDLRGRVLFGAAAFVFPLLLANVVAVYFYYALAENYGAAVAWPLIIIQGLQVIGYSIFLALSWKY